MKRRTFLRLSTATSLSLAFGGFPKMTRALERGAAAADLSARGFGELRPMPAKNTGETVLALPRGFSYNVLGSAGDRMSDGRPTPGKHDGMAAFDVGGELRLVRNHEINDKVPLDDVAIGSGGHYDDKAGGGTTTLVVDPETRTIRRDFVSLGGTLNNCAGGPTPWGSWISCEETTLGAAVYEDEGNTVGGFAHPHGYCFEVPAAANGCRRRLPLKTMGRFSHEAVAVDPRSGIVYLTEDSKPDCGFYRFLPATPGRLAKGGVLQALAVAGRDNYDTQFGQVPGKPLPVRWVTIDDPDPAAAETDEQAVIRQGTAKGAARFEKLEGCWSAADGRVWFVSSSGGDGGGGQVWLFEPDGRDSGRLTLVFESPGRDLLDMPDNLCLDPRSPNLYLCEDSDYEGVSGTRENHVRVLTPGGKIADFARNVRAGYEESELAGATFSPDGRTLFFNVQNPGLTVAVWGDFEAFEG